MVGGPQLGDLSKAAFADTLREARRRKRWSQEELARRLEVSVTTVSRWETGKQEPDLRALRKLDKIFGSGTLGV
jgi:transcriptional regulator with XRE-family HTH domain